MREMKEAESMLGFVSRVVTPIYTDGIVVDLDLEINILELYRYCL